MSVRNRTGAATEVASRPPIGGRLAGSRSRRAAVAGVALTGLATSLLVSSGAAQAGTPPQGPGNMEIMPKRDMVMLDGYVEQAGETATVTVTRDGRQIGIGQGILDANGFLEFNHPGGSCWTGVTPNIVGGDLVEVSFSETSFTDGTVTGSNEITSVTKSEYIPTAEAGDVEGTVTISGTVGDDVDPSRFVVEVVNPDMRVDKTPEGEEPGLLDARAIGWTPVTDPEHPNGEEGVFTAEGTFENGRFEATFGFYDENDHRRVFEGEHVSMSWMADGANDLALGATQDEHGEIDGPGFPGCPAGPGAQPPVPPQTATLTTTADTETIEVSWTTPEQPTDAEPISAFRVSAADSRFPGQEVGVETDGDATSVTISGLVSGQEYPVEIEAYNGQWSPPQPLGTATPGTAAGGTPTDPGDPNTAPAAPAGVSASATGLDAVEVSWTASPGAASYEVTATSADANAIIPAAVTVDAPATSATVDGLSSGTAYTFSVTATNGAGTSDAGTADATTLEGVAPSAVRITRALSTHEGITLEWTAAEAGNAASPVSGYELVATPASGDPVSADVGSVTSGTITGLTNGTAYEVAVFARSGDLRSSASTNANGVPASVTPNDQVTISRSEFRQRGNQWRVQGTVLDSTANRVVVRAGGPTGPLIGPANGVAVAEDGTWIVDIRNGPALPGNRQVHATSTSGGTDQAGIDRIR